MQTTRIDSPALETLAQKAASQFADRFGRRPRWLVAAPGRVNLMGEHTDYNGGFVLPMAINRHVVIAADTAADARACCHSSTLGETAEFALAPPPAPGEPRWANYVRGVVAGFQATGIAVPGFDCLIENDLPLGSGLSSSAAVEVATATLLEATTGHRLDPLAKVRLCQQAEHRFAGVPCGIMDQYTSTLAEAGKALLIDCADETARAVPIDSHQVAVLIVNSTVRHALTGSPYAERRAQCQRAAEALNVPRLRDVSSHRLEAFRDRLTATEYRRARHVITANERALQMAESLSKCDWLAAGQLMYASHASMRDDFEISCRELDVLVELASSLGTRAGVYGSRMTGGGFGGCTVTLVRSDRATNVGEAICHGFERATGNVCGWFVTHPVAGARVLESPGPHAGARSDHFALNR